MKAIKSEVEAREMSKGIKISDSKKTETPRKGTLPTTAAFVTRDGGSNERRCVYCKADHYSASCTKISEAAKHRDSLKKGGRCFLSLNWASY